MMISIWLQALEGFEIDGKLKKPNFEFGSEQVST